MSRILQVNHELDEAQKRLNEVKDHIKKLKKYARDLSFRVQNDANRLAGKAAILLIADGHIVDGPALAAKAKEIANASDDDAYSALIDRLTPASKAQEIDGADDDDAHAVLVDRRAPAGGGAALDEVPAEKNEGAFSGASDAEAADEMPKDVESLLGARFKRSLTD
jgi:hypothetical protein